MIKICEFCKKKFDKNNYECKRQKTLLSFCSKKCYSDYGKMIGNETLICYWCKKDFIRRKNLGRSRPKKLKNVFCSRSCSAKHSNTQRRRSIKSKCETMLYNLVLQTFPQLKPISDDRETLNGLEIDIYIPSLKLGIEWNGIVHFKPIYGEEALRKTQYRDENKLKLANTLGINLIVIPDLVSTEKYVKEAFEKIKIIIEDLLETHSPNGR